jgi:hypothetical protein
MSLFLIPDRSAGSSAGAHALRIPSRASTTDRTSVRLRRHLYRTLSKESPVETTAGIGEESPEFVLVRRILA